MATKIRVLQVLSNRFYLGGAEIMVYQLLTTLDRTRFEPAAISYFDPAGSHLDAALAEAGIPVWYLDKRLGFDPGVSLRIDAVLREFRPDVVHTHLAALRYALLPLMRRRPRAMLHTVHTLAQKESARWENHLAFRLGVVPVAIADEVTASVRRAHGLSHFPVIPNGVPVDAFAPPPGAREAWREAEGFAPDDLLFTSVARLMAPKNQPLLVEAFERAAADLPRAHLLLVGDGEMRPQLERTIAERGLAGRVHLLGRRTDVPAVLGASDVFVLGSDWEGNPLSVMEAMAAGRPVLATAVGGVPELVEDGTSGMLVPPRDPAALSRAMAHMAAHPEARAAMGREAARRARARFDVRAMTRAYEALYERLLSPSDRRLHAS